MAPLLGLIDTSFTTKISADTKNIIFTNIQKYSKKIILIKEYLVLNHSSDCSVVLGFLSYHMLPYVVNLYLK